MKLEAGMYIRTKCTYFCNQVVIRQINEIDEDDKNSFLIDEYVCDVFGNWQDHLHLEDVEKASFNITDVIVVGDIIEWETTSPYFDGGINEVINYFGKVGVYLVQGDTVRELKDINIKSIVTQEDFENISYRIGDDK